MNFGATPGGGAIATLPLEFWTRMVQASIEVGIFAIVVFAAIRIGQVRSQRLISSLWLLVMVKPVLTLCVGSIIPLYTIVERIPYGNAFAGPALAVLVPIPFRQMVGVDSAATALPLTSYLLQLVLLDFGGILAVMWMIGIGISLGRHLRGRSVVSKMLAQSTAAPAMLQGKFLAIADELRLCAVPRFRVAKEIDTPAIVGFLAPTVLIPVWMTDSEHGVTAEWAMRHELTHWLHGDPVANGLRQLCLTVFFFHPVVWWAAKKWEEGAEFACDHATVSSPELAREYANALFEVVQRMRQPSSANGMICAVNSNAGRRIQALVSTSSIQTTPSSKHRVLLAVILLTMAFVGAIGIDFAYAESTTVAAGDVAPYTNGALTQSPSSTLGSLPVP